MMPAAFDDLYIEIEPTQNADYLSTAWKWEDIRATKSYIQQRRATLPNFRRLENALWRAWMQQSQNIPCVSSTLLHWDKETDTTWLFGPRKCSASDLSGATPDDICEKNMTSIKVDARNPRKRGILLSSQRCQVQKLLGNFALAQKHHAREISKRVSFNYEVEQVRSLPEPVYDFTTLLNDYEAQDTIMRDVELNHLRMVFNYQQWYHTILLLPPTDLKGVEDTYPQSFSNSNFYTDEDTL
ncbi:Protein of unknown function DUF1752, fungi [Penicillium italicum]|uniref:Nitrogen regulatory protein areA GATA-like domain-containing protein n=1 Tax=Penicillium italicum TaxID=40296 RepID=A0A0A2L8N7_PENIT|nr:Protein of unknown function DUF1752, fungi [Penicillium italicum]